MISKIDTKDWLLNSQKALILKVDANISTVIVNDGINKKLYVENVSEGIIDKLYFITNTDQNNNYLYIEDFKVYIGGSPTPCPIQGLDDTVKDVYYNSDISSFLNGDKIQYPFNGLLYQQNCAFRGTTFSEYVDFASACTPLSPTTIGFKKTYAFTVNPDSFFPGGTGINAQSQGITSSSTNNLD